MQISIVIPVFNEGEKLLELLDFLTEKKKEGRIKEVIVVDYDNSTAVTNHLVTYIQSPKKGRGHQMHVGAESASGEVLYFLHADTMPPDTFDQDILTAVHKGALSGCFRLRFDHKHTVLRVSQWFTRFPFLICRGGDQSLFVTKEYYREAGGFDTNLEIMEDIEIITRLRKKSKFKIIPKEVVTSSRKYNQNGVWRLQYHFAILHLKNFMGVSNGKLRAYYDRHVK